MHVRPEGLQPGQDALHRAHRPRVGGAVQRRLELCVDRCGVRLGGQEEVRSMAPRLSARSPGILCFTVVGRRRVLVYARSHTYTCTHLATHRACLPAYQPTHPARY